MGEAPHVQFVMGVKNAMPAEERLLDILLAETRRVLPKATWTAAGIGVNQSRVMEWALARQADGVRTGLEDNIRLGKDRLARSNAELVEVAVALMAEHGAQAGEAGRGARDARPGAGLNQPGLRERLPAARKRRCAPFPTPCRSTRPCRGSSRP